MGEPRRQRNRYIVFRIRSETPLSERAVVGLLAEATNGIQTRLVHFDGERGILRCAHTAKDGVIAALNAFHRPNRDDVSIATIGTSGTIRRAISKFLK